jgi:hypothetical protein
MVQWLGDGQLDDDVMAMDIVTATGCQWKRDSNGNGNGWLGNGRLGNGWHKGLAMEGSTATRWR